MTKRFIIFDGFVVYRGLLRPLNVNFEFESSRKAAEIKKKEWLNIAVSTDQFLNEFSQTENWLKFKCLTLERWGYCIRFVGIRRTFYCPDDKALLHRPYTLRNIYYNIIKVL